MDYLLTTQKAMQPASYTLWQSYRHAMVINRSGEQTH